VESKATSFSIETAKSLVNEKDVTGGDFPIPTATVKGTMKASIKSAVMSV